MKVEIFEIDDNGYIIEKHVFDESEELPSNKMIKAKPKNGLFKPKWTGDEWIESMPQEEIDALRNQTRELTEIEKLKISQAEQFETILELIGGI